MRAHVIDTSFTMNADGGFYEVTFSGYTGNWKVRDLQTDRTICTIPETRARQFLNPGRAIQILEQAFRELKPKPTQP